ncbi:MAG: biopolymer transporter ExbD [Pseudomonadota bacterium]
MARQPLPELPRRYRFALTPLADAMFQLLIFFMLSSSLTPYSLITLKSGPPETEAPEEDDSINTNTGGAGDGPPATPELPTLWTVGRDTVLASGQTYRIDQLVELAEAIGSQGAETDIILIVREDARVQDVASAMEALENADIQALQITKAGS